jgi:Fic family protein
MISIVISTFIRSGGIMKRIAGKWKTNLTGLATYKSYDPAPLPPNPSLELDAETIELLIDANNKIALLDGLSQRVSNVNMFISMYVRKEALMSSQIEGTQATLDDILDPLIAENTNQNVADVINYIKAIEFAIARLKDLPLCNRLLRETHAILMEGARGQEKTPGEFRKSQNWIGGQGSTIITARYIPPSVEDMEEALSQLEHYINQEQFDALSDLNVLVRTALIHYQFETIHPFLDGNGRVGRLLITLFLMEQEALFAPALYISYYLKRNRIEYYDRMTYVRTDGDYEQWIKFFLQAIKESADDAIKAIDRLTTLHGKNVSIISKLGRSSKNVMKLFTYLEENPIIETRKTATALSLSFNTVASAVSRLCDAGILVQVSNARRNRTFSYEEYLEILRSGT